MFEALRAGMVVVNVNPLYTPRELEHQLKDSGVTAIVILENFEHTLSQVIGPTPIRTIITTQVGDLLPPLKRRLADAVAFNQVLAAGRTRSLDEVALTHDDLAFLQYTGGTTGVAKGAMLTHGICQPS